MMHNGIATRKLTALLVLAVLLLILAAPALAQDKVFEYYAPYTLGTFLKGYNIVSFGNAQMGIHCMGAVIVQGDFDTRGPWGGGASGYGDGVNLPPSYVHGKIIGGAQYNNRHAVGQAPLYVNPEKNNVLFQYNQYSVNGIVTGNHGQTPVYKNKNFFDFEQAWAAVVSGSYALQQGGKAVHMNNNYLAVNMGESVIIDASELPENSYVATVNVVGDVSKPVNTVITIRGGGKVYLPLCNINGSQYSSSEASKIGTSIIWNLPDATEVIVDSAPTYGHIIAPNAHITKYSGQYAGCIIGQSMYINAEGHSYNYYGDDLPENPLYLVAHKNIIGQMPDNTPWSFSYELEAASNSNPMPEGSTKNADDKLSSIATVTNSDSQYMGQITARFGKIKYTQAGVYTYTIREVSNPRNPNFGYDDREYTITVTAESLNGGVIASAEFSVNGEPAQHIEFSNRFLGNAKPGSIRLVKVDQYDPDKTLEGAVYSIYADEECTQFVADMPATGENGESTLGQLSPGQYYVREKTPPVNYGIDNTAYPVLVESGKTVTVNAENGGYVANIYGPGSILVSKDTVGGGDDQVFTFIVDVQASDLTGVYATFNGVRNNAISQDLHDGQATIWFTNGDEMEIFALPLNTKMTITEQGGDGEYTTTVNGKTGNQLKTSFPDGALKQTAEFVNTYAETTPKPEVTPKPETTPKPTAAPTTEEIKNLPATGDTQSLILWIALLSVAGCSLLLLKKKAC